MFKKGGFENEIYTVKMFTDVLNYDKYEGTFREMREVMRRVVDAGAGKYKMIEVLKDGVTDGMLMCSYYFRDGVWVEG